jgi:methylthioribulose-1-phosphate dehydratase
MLNFEESAEHLADAAREFYRRGWVLGTSGNFSSLIEREPLEICITASGNEKGELTASHFLIVDENGAVASGDGKPSAEMLLHLAIYRLHANASAILHTHSVWGTILSDKFYEFGGIEIEGYEMLKGLTGVTTHEHLERLPVIENSQNYVALAHVVENTLRENASAHGVYLRRHGLYTWGASISEAKRHVEIFEFLFEVLGRSLK